MAFSKLPDFLVIGAKKYGTTSLYKYLGEHPDVYVSEPKEPNFFAFENESIEFDSPDTENGRGLKQWSISNLGDYRGLFAAAGTRLAGEASWTSLYYSRAAKRIKNHIPRVKLFAVLRNPVDRAYSNFKMLQQAGIENSFSFEDGLQRERQRIEAGWSPVWHYQSLGYYGKQLKVYYDLFGSDQIKIYTFDDFKNDTEVTIRDAFSFLGVDSKFSPDVATVHGPSWGVVRNRAIHQFMVSDTPVHKLVRAFTTQTIRKKVGAAVYQYGFKKQPVSAETRSRLVGEYEDDIRLLEELTGRDFKHWVDV